jgi:hypothetical protein
MHDRYPLQEVCFYPLRNFLYNIKKLLTKPCPTEVILYLLNSSKFIDFSFANSKCLLNFTRIKTPLLESVVHYLLFMWVTPSHSAGGFIFSPAAYTVTSIPVNRVMPDNGSML